MDVIQFNTSNHSFSYTYELGSKDKILAGNALGTPERRVRNK